MDFGKCAEHFADLRHTILFNAHEESNEVGIILSYLWTRVRPSRGVDLPSQFSGVFALVQGAFSYPSVRRVYGLRLHFTRTVLPKHSWPSGPHFQSQSRPENEKVPDRAETKTRKREKPRGQTLKIPVLCRQGSMFPPLLEVST